MIKDFPMFTPNVTPQQMVTLGIFGGTYFRPIYSSVTKERYENAHKEFKWSESTPDNKICSSQYDTSVNYYNVKCGTSLEFWESKNWIKAQDPYGWFQWYCRFYQGRRSEDDMRQINRWLKLAGPKGRFFTRSKKSPVIKQVLLHWGMFMN